MISDFLQEPEPLLDFKMWLHLSCGLSRLNCQQAIKEIQNLFQHMPSNFGLECNLENILPCDVPTIIKQLNLEAPFERYVCFPKCYSLYDIELSPKECQYMPTIKSNPCGTKPFLSFKLRPLSSINFTLKTPRVFRPPWLPGQICLSRQPQLHNPQRKFVYQPIKSWLKWFLNVPGIKDKRDKWASKISNNDTENLSDFSQGDVWKRSSSKSVQKHTLELRFSLFVYWFNPRGNKIFGKQVSVGILALNCLNLPPWLLDLSKNTPVFLE
ncbi:hypothetical protein O181_018836 [Austropuccinia psidii MF-1]|uniref:Uncharacterized protein n=1 Tax=Austropuccinia psidii MF-1 TaxID=1389203 RepID=A0A9Q3CAC5_9BASI|nr:hypothetical protein [Austropuccinia psidii MF-1]